MSDFLTALQALADKISAVDAPQHKFADHNVVRATRDVAFEESFPDASAEDIATAKRIAGVQSPISAGELYVILKTIETGDGIPYLVAGVGSKLPPAFAPEDAFEFVADVYDGGNRSDGLKIGSKVVAQRDLTLRDIFGDRGEVMNLIETLRSARGSSQYLIKRGDAGEITEFDPFNEGNIIVATSDVPTGAPVSVSDFALA